MPSKTDTLDDAVKRETPRPYILAKDGGAGARERLLIALCDHSYIGRVTDTPAIDAPITQDEAQRFILSQIGPVSEAKLQNMLHVAWTRLSYATSPEQMLSLEHLITAISIGIGMMRHEEAPQIIERNLLREETRGAAEMQTHALNRWRRLSRSADQG